MRFRPTVCLIASTILLGSVTHANTIRWARSDDALSLDPHATSQAITANFLTHIYETLVDADASGKIVPRLATEWYRSETNPKVWVFKLRENVTFHDGADFTAEDVVFSLNRARSDAAATKGYHTGVADVRAIDNYTVEVETVEPMPTYPNQLIITFMMDKDWSEAHDLTKVQDFKSGDENFAVRNENGTGPYVLKDRDPGVKSTMTTFESHWAETKPDVTGIEFFVISDAATRTAALLSGEVDLILDVPSQDVTRLGQTDGVKIVSGPENRVLFFGYRMAGDLNNAKTGTPSPFADARVREAVELAVDRDAITTMIMRGASIPTDVVAPPFVHGYTDDLPAYPAPDIEQAKALLAEAGYPDGFTVTLDTPNNRYPNDEAISQATAGMLGRAGIKVNLASRPVSQHSQTVFKGESDFWLLGWGVPTFDTSYTFNGLYHSRTGTYGSYNLMGYVNPDLDALIEAVNVEMDPSKRDDLIAQTWDIIQSDRPILALHNQILSYAMRDNVTLEVHPSDMPRMDTVTFE
ncbi:MAG: ABC transporter substrate-binding protein [Qingshengfaniella sp.]